MNYYELLQISPDASADEIEQAYRRLARTINPDLNPNDPLGAAARMKDLNEIRRILTDPVRKAQYDWELTGGPQARNAGSPAPDLSTTSYSIYEPAGGDVGKTARRKKPPATLIIVGFAIAVLLGISSGYWLHRRNHPAAIPTPAGESSPPIKKSQELLLQKQITKSGSKIHSSAKSPSSLQSKPEVISPGSTRAEVLRVLGPPQSSSVNPYSNEETLNYDSLQLVLRDGRVKYGTTRK